MVIRYLDSFLHGDELYIVLEWASNGDLKDLISSFKERNEKMTEHLVWTYFSQVRPGPAPPPLPRPKSML